jgi:hypothetical protein
MSRVGAWVAASPARCNSLCSVTVTPHLRLRDVKLASVLAFHLMIATAGAQQGRLFATVEAVVGNSEAVYVGSIKSLRRDPNQPGTAGNLYHIVVSVGETLKGSPCRELTLDLDTFFGDAVLTGWMEQGARFLWLSGVTDQGLTLDLMAKMGMTNTVPPPSVLWFRSERIFTMDFRVIATWEALLKEARSFSKKRPKREDLMDFDIPSSLALMCQYPNAFAIFEIPKTSERESMARDLIVDPAKMIARANRRSRDTTMPKLNSEDLLSLRLTGVALIADFPSTRNKTLLEALLNDGALRHRAKAVLQGWRVGHT